MSGLGDLLLAKSTEQVTAEALGRMQRWSRHVPKAAGEVETIVRVGRPHREIAAAALEMQADLVVIGDSARNWFEGETPRRQAGRPPHDGDSVKMRPLAPVYRENGKAHPIQPGQPVG